MAPTRAPLDAMASSSPSGRSRGFDSSSLPRIEGESPPSVISHGMDITGTIRCRGPLQLEGSLDGSISCPELAVGPTGAIVGDIEARDLRVEGDVQGSIQCDSLDLGSTAAVDGLLECRTLVLAKGAKLTGDVRIG
jgi:cytoskeletal protein CcmA (bactofilin family)